MNDGAKSGIFLSLLSLQSLMPLLGFFWRVGS
jgi:hypothetical protein